jgi:hypothetical protein
MPRSSRPNPKGQSDTFSLSLPRFLHLRQRRRNSARLLWRHRPSRQSPLAHKGIAMPASATSPLLPAAMDPRPLTRRHHAPWILTLRHHESRPSQYPHQVSRSLCYCGLAPPSPVFPLSTVTWGHAAAPSGQRSGAPACGEGTSGPASHRLSRLSGSISFSAR